MTKDCKTTEKKKQTPVFFLEASLLNKQGGDPNTHAVGGVAALFFVLKFWNNCRGKQLRYPAIVESR